ncbi:DUF386 domain-containing protein [Clostridiales bacterium COT073_COT-073]|nr:DUF386 domain-containing protein [Clostridiales bacterium COT073_COT-073]
MILDNLQNAQKYYGLSENIKKGLQYLEQTDFSKLEDGTYELDGRDVFVALMSYQSKMTSRFEAHHQYLDIQYVIDGSGEIMGYAPVEVLGEETEAAAEKDIYFYDNAKPEVETKLLVKKGMFAIFFPGDGHRPSCAWNQPEAMRKAVVKIKVS